MIKIFGFTGQKVKTKMIRVKKPMSKIKKVLYLDVYNIKTLDNPVNAYKFIKEAKKTLTTYNQLMSYYENGGRDIGAIFITQKDSIMFQHLPLFCLHFNIELYALPTEAEITLSSIFCKKYVNLVCLYKEDQSYAEFKRLTRMDAHQS